MSRTDPIQDNSDEAPAPGEAVNESPLEEIPSEVADRDTSLVSFEIFTYPADYPLEVLVNKWSKQEIVLPNFQRRFVWSQNQSSKLIDSFLKGLPVPAIFLYSDLTTSKLLVVDGQQRLKTIAYFFRGLFGDDGDEPRREFRLTGLEEDSPYEGLTYESLGERDPSAFAKLNNSVLRSFVIKQLNPADDTSIYHVFERLNTGGTLLLPQEIRNCVHHGTFNDMLVELNQFSPWRRLFGKERVDRRQRDVELILRFLALAERAESYKKPMKDFLNKFMGAQKSITAERLEVYRRLFVRTASVVSDTLDERPFHIRRGGLNAAVFDSVFVAVSRNLDSMPSDFKDRYYRLVGDDAFQGCVTSGTTDAEIVARRISLATESLG